MALATRQHGVISTAELRRFGLTEKAIRWRVETGILQPLFVGVFLVAGSPRTWEQRITAAIRWGGDGAVASYKSAAALWRFDGFEPGPLEIWAAQTSLRASLAREAPQGPNPVELTDANLIAGIQLYGERCAICHGTAKGQASASPVAKGLYPQPPQLATEGVEDDPDGVLFWTILHGIRLTGMPSWANALSDQQIWTLTLFLKHMDKLPPAAQQVWQNVRN